MPWAPDVAALAAWLAGKAPQLTWRGDGSAYLSSEVGLYLRNLPQTGRAVALAAYPVDDNPALPMGTVGIQVMTRGTTDPADADLIAGWVFDALHGATHFWAGTSHVAQAIRQSGSPLGQDDSNRWLRSDNYYLDFDVPPTSNRPL